MNAGLDALLYEPMGIGGIPLATAIVSLITTVALALVLRGRLGGLDLARTLDVGIGCCSPAALLAAVTFGVREALAASATAWWTRSCSSVRPRRAGLAVYAAAVLAHARRGGAPDPRALLARASSRGCRVQSALRRAYPPTT